MLNQIQDHPNDKSFPFCKIICMCVCVYVCVGVCVLRNYFKDRSKLEYVSLTITLIKYMFSSGTVFTTLNYLPNLRIGPIS
jgi:hypothetical protein